MSIQYKYCTVNKVVITCNIPVVHLDVRIPILTQKLRELVLNLKVVSSVLANLNSCRLIYSILYLKLLPFIVLWYNLNI